MSRWTSRSVRYSRLRLPALTFTEAEARSRSRVFSMEIALQPIHTVTNSRRDVTDCQRARTSGALCLNGEPAFSNPPGPRRVTVGRWCNNATAASPKATRTIPAPIRRSDEDVINAARLIRLLTRMARDYRRNLPEGARIRARSSLMRSRSRAAFMASVEATHERGCARRAPARDSERLL